MELGTSAGYKELGSISIGSKREERMDKREVDGEEG